MASHGAEETEMLDRAAIRKLGVSPDGAPLSRVEQVALVETMQEGEPALAKMAQDVLVMRNINLAHKVTRKFVDPANQDYADAHAEAMIGLIEGLQRFDLSVGTAISTYVVQWIEMRVREWAQRNRQPAVNGGHELRRFAAKVRQTSRKLAYALQREPTAADIANELDEKLDRVEDALAYDQSTVSTDAPIDAAEGIAVQDTLAYDDGDVSEIAHRAEIIAMIRELLADLPQAERDIIMRSFGMGAQIADEIESETGASTAERLASEGIYPKINARRVMAMRQKILAKLRKSLGEKGLTELTA